MPSPSLLQRLKERKLVQWALAYLAGAWVLFEVSDAVGGRLGWPDTLYQALLVILAIGFFITLVIAWYHGEKGRQKASGPELLMVAALLVVAGGVLSMVGREGGGVPEETETVATAAVEDDRPAIAVLPFENLSPDPENGFFADGMQEEITSKLSQISALRVPSRSSVMQYKDERPSSRQIAEELGVDFILEGSARLSGGQVRLTVQLIDARRDAHLWAEDYDLRLSAENLFEVEGDAARQIAFEIGVNLTPRELDEVGRVLTDNTDAYLLFMQGTDAFVAERVWGRSATTYESVRLLERAVERDSDFALAHARLALSLTYSSLRENQERAGREAEAALRLLPNLAEARVAIGRTSLLMGEAEEARRHFLAAQAEAPNLSLALTELGLLERTLGEFEAGLQTLRRAEGLDPRNPIIQREIARSLMFHHRYEEALEANRIREAVQPSYAGIRDRIWIHLLRGDSVQARTAIEELLATDAWGFYNFIPHNPYDVIRRVLTPEERQIAFDSYEVFLGEADRPCIDYPGYCLRKAFHLGAVGSGEGAGALWDSLRVVADSRSPEGTSYLSVFAYQGVGDKEAAIRAAELYLARTEDGFGRLVPDLGYGIPRSQILLARVLTHFGEDDRALDQLEDLLPTPSWLTVHILGIDPVWDPLRDHPRFQALLEEYRDDVEH